MSPPALPSVTVVLLSYRARRWLPLCLEALAHQRGVEFDVVIVDQGNRDGSTEAALTTLPAALVGKVELLAAGRNLGFAGGVNLALTRARGEWLALLNCDALPSPGWLAALVEAAEQEGAAMVASRIHLLRAPDQIENLGHALYPDGLNVPRARGQALGPAHTHRREVLCPSGAAGLYLRRAVEEVGGLAESFFAYGEDLDLGLCLRARGHRCVYEPRAHVLHELSASWGASSARKAFYVERNRLYVVWRHFPAAALPGAGALTLARWLATGTAGMAGRGPLAGNGAATPLAGLATLAGAAAGVVGLPGRLRERRELLARGACGVAHYPGWVRRFGASLGEVARTPLGPLRQRGGPPAGGGVVVSSPEVDAPAERP